MQIIKLSDNVVCATMIMSLYFPGVYLTHLSQDVDKLTVAKNCWGQGYHSAISDGKLDYVIRIEIPSKELRRREEGKRVVYVYEGHLHLHNYQHKFITLKEENDNSMTQSTVKNDGIVLILILGVFAFVAIFAVRSILRK